MRKPFSRRATSLALGALLVAGLQLGASAGATQSRAVAPRTLSPGDHTLTLTVDHVARSLILHVPVDDTAVHRPLLLIYHGATDTDSSTEHMTDFSQVADTTGEVVAYLQGVGDRWNEQAGQSTDAQVNDVAYTNAVISLIERLLPFDHKRIVAVGFSNGALMVQDLGCKIAGQLALIVPVEGEIAAVSSPGCHPSRPIRVYEIHGTADTEIYYNGGPIGGSGTVVLSAPKSVARWAQLDHCSPLTPATSYPSSSVKLTTYARCRDRVKVVLRTLIGGVHQWTNDIGQLVEGVLPPP
jgi:polyhydroxybutyrate depolymerase